ncbi:siphovirus ReqiPepy6 Gp37-like family protein [Faecalispora jeddahensis]|uniref:siphovirus ReqiPepy6 Gp37-like family protein n=1 Tax=Faecalispora jeddahensis TaxID=1414721 RepID=UPI0028A8F407|nr:siphovirus ReqiPepy6 Gp37-like family protein [Faecalispora jeddahensis]
MDLLIYSPDIVSVGVVDCFSSLRWRRKYFEPGEFELHCAATADNLETLAQGNIIHRLDRREAGIIEGVVVGESTAGDEEITVTGRMGSCLLCQRIITPTINYSGTVEIGMRKVVSDNAITARPIANLTLGVAQGYPETCAFQATGKNVQTTLTALAKASGFGYIARLDVPGRQWVFEVYKGSDKSVIQTTGPYVLFSDEFGNITGPQYTYNEQAFKNYAYVAGEGEGSARVIIEVDQTGGEPRREMWVDARDLQKGELTDAQYRAQLTQRGLEKLAEAARSESFEAAAVSTANFEYITDWNLGNIVSFEKWGILLNRRITEVEEVYENSVVTITPVCGTPLPETLDLGDDV